MPVRREDLISLECRLFGRKPFPQNHKNVVDKKLKNVDDVIFRVLAFGIRIFTKYASLWPNTTDLYQNLYLKLIGRGIDPILLCNDLKSIGTIYYYIHESLLSRVFTLLFMYYSIRNEFITTTWFSQLFHFSKAFKSPVNERYFDNSAVNGRHAKMDYSYKRAERNWNRHVCHK